MLLHPPEFRPRRNFFSFCRVDERGRAAGRQARRHFLFSPSLCPAYPSPAPTGPSLRINWWTLHLLLLLTFLQILYRHVPARCRYGIHPIPIHVLVFASKSHVSHRRRGAGARRFLWCLSSSVQHAVMNDDSRPPSLGQSPSADKQIPP